MPKRVNYAQTHALQTQAPASVADGVQTYAAADGVHAVLPSGQDHLLSRQTLFVSATQPTVTYPHVWWQLLPNGDLTMWVNDGAP